MEQLDPATGNPLPEDAIQRILFLSNSVHVYNIPPLPSTKGHSASAWTSDPSRHIFTARCRVLETSYSDDDEDGNDNEQASGELKVDVVLEDPSTGQLFAACPYTSHAAVETVLDSSRFFAVTVKDPQGRKAVLGIGFEERSEAFDFGVALQEARRGLGWEAAASSVGGAGLGKQQQQQQQKHEEEEKKDYSLKEGETITVNIGSTGIGRRRAQQQQDRSSEESSGNLQSFALPPPPGSGGASAGGESSSGGFNLPPPPRADDVKRKRRSAQQLGFDDGKFGEFA